MNTKNRSIRNLLVVIAALTALFASFGIALAAVVQVSREVPATTNIIDVEVLPDEQLVISHDPGGFDPVNEIQIELTDFQPPLDTLSGWFEDVYVRNDSAGVLTLVEPCRDVFDHASDLNLGHFSIHDPDTHEDSCDRNLEFGPGESRLLRLQLEDHGRTEAGPGTYTFTAIFGAIGEAEIAPLPAPTPQTPAGSAIVAVRDVPGGENGLNSAGAPEALHHWGVGETLFLRADDDSTIPWIATGWTVRPDLSGATIDIRQGIPFQSNRGSFGDLTAHDIAFSMNDANAATNPGSNHGQAGDFAGLWTEWNATNDSTIEFDFTNFDSTWKDDFLNQSGSSLSILSKNAFDTMGAAWVQQNVVATGPFEIEGWIPDDKVTIVNRFISGGDHYLPELTPLTDRVEFIEIDDPQVRAALLINGQVDAAELSAQESHQFANSEFGQTGAARSIQLGVFFSGNLWEDVDARTGEPLPPKAPFVHDLPWIGSPGKHDGGVPDDDMEQARLVRRALALAIDKDAVHQSLLGGRGRTVEVEYFSTGHPNWDPKWEYPYDPGQARDILANQIEADYQQGSADTSQENLNGNAFEVAIYAGPELGGGNFITGDVADAVAGFWANLGLTTFSLKYSYQQFRPTVVERSNTIPWVTSCDLGNESNPWHFPKGLVQTTLTRGGFSCGFESPEILDFYNGMAVAPDIATATQAATEYLDYVYHWVLQPGVVAVPDDVYYNPNKIASWTMAKSQKSTIGSVWDLELN